MAPTGYKPGPVSAVPPDMRPAAKPPPKAPAKTPPVRAAPLSPIDQAVNRLGTPLTDEQIQANAQGQLAPLIKALTDSIGKQAQAGTQAIGGYTSELAHQLGGFQQNAANIYGGAESAQAASDAALSQKLSGEGGAQAQVLGSQLASINAPGATNAAVQDATQTASGAGNALYATGSASLANLIASGAAEQSYASKLPGIADLSGLQQTGQLQSSLAKSLADKTGELQAKVPDIVAGLQGDRQTLINNRESLREKIGADQAKAADAAYKRQFDLAKYKTGIDEFNARQGQSQQRIDLESRRLAQTQFNSDRSYQISLANLGIAQAGLQLKVTQNAFKAAHGGFTKPQITKFKLQANALANTAYHGSTTTKTDKNGVVTSSTTGAGQPYFQALGTMMKKGIPVQQALVALDRVYPANLRPSEEALQKELGPLTPAAITKQVQVNAGTPGVAGTAITNPTALLGAGGMKFARVDQGVDFVASKPVPALASGNVVSITKGMAGGTGHIIKVRLDQPVTVNGHTYYGIYYSEQTPLVGMGKRVTAGQPVMAAGGNEIGFLDQNMQMPPLIGGLGAGTKPSVGGQDFYTWIGGR